MAKDKFGDDISPYKPVDKVNLEVAKRVLRVVNKGLTEGVGSPVPGEMCVEAAVCYAMGQNHGDDPKCVAEVLRSFKIQVNDSSEWNSDKSRANGLRRLAVIQLGTKGKLTAPAFNKAASMAMLQGTFKRALHTRLKERDRTDDEREYADTKLALQALKGETIAQIAKRLKPLYSYENIGYRLLLRGKTTQAIRLYNDINSTFYTGDSDREEQLAIDLCEDTVQALRRLKVPGARFLKLTKLPKRAASIKD